MVMLKQWEPAGSAIPMRRLVDRLFDEAFIRPGDVAGSIWNQAGVPFDLYEEGDTYVFTAALPGINAAEVEVTVNRGLLQVKGQRSDPQEAEGRTWRFRGLPRGSFEIATNLPGEVDAGAAEAGYEHGLLTIRLPKSETAKVRRIAVRENGAALPEATAK